MTSRTLTAIVEPDGDWYVAYCPEVDIASQGKSQDDAVANLREALELFFETAPDTEIKSRLFGARYVTQVEVAIG